MTIAHYECRGAFAVESRVMKSRGLNLTCKWIDPSLYPDIVSEETRSNDYSDTLIREYRKKALSTVIMRDQPALADRRRLLRNCASYNFRSRNGVCLSDWGESKRS